MLALGSLSNMIKLLRIIYPILLFAISQTAIAAEKVESLTEGMVNPGYHEKPAWFKESFLDIREDLEEAASENRRVLLYFYQDGCPYCGKLLRDNFGDMNIANYSQQHFDVIAINMWGDREVVGVDGETTTEKLFSKGLKVQFTPTLLFLNEDGKVLLRINGYFAPHKYQTAMRYIAEKKENSISVRDYFKMASPEKATGVLHNDITNLVDGSDLTKRAEAKPLVVMFEQQVCKACDELHLDILKKEPVIQSLKALDVVVLDMWSDKMIKTPAGQQLKIKDWAKNLGIHYSPSMVFFDNAGEEVFRTEAYLRTFHTKAAFDYVATGTYKQTPEFQRYVQKLADDLHAQGIEFDLME